MNIAETTTKMLIERLRDQMDAVFTEGLRLRGFEFENRLEIENFIKEHCRCEDNTDSKQRVYFVKDVPFLLHNYAVDLSLPKFDESEPFKIAAEYGSWAYL